MVRCAHCGMTGRPIQLARITKLHDRFSAPKPPRPACGERARVRGDCAAKLSRKYVTLNRLFQVACSYSKRLVSVPMPSMTMLTLLPGFIEPTPTDVPQAITSPASSGMSCEIRLTRRAGEKMMSESG